jgi:hypothetical protein
MVSGGGLASTFKGRAQREGVSESRTDGGRGAGLPFDDLAEPSSHAELKMSLKRGSVVASMNSRPERQRASRGAPGEAAAPRGRSDAETEVNDVLRVVRTNGRKYGTMVGLSFAELCSELAKDAPAGEETPSTPQALALTATLLRARLGGDVKYLLDWEDEDEEEEDDDEKRLVCGRDGEVRIEVSIFPRRSIKPDADKAGPGSAAGGCSPSAPPEGAAEGPSCKRAPAEAQRMRRVSALPAARPLPKQQCATAQPCTSSATADKSVLAGFGLTVGAASSGVIDLESGVVAGTPAAQPQPVPGTVSTRIPRSPRRGTSDGESLDGGDQPVLAAARETPAATSAPARRKSVHHV